MMEMSTTTVNGVIYQEVPDMDQSRSCIGCVGDTRTGEGICGALPNGCSSPRDTQWRRVTGQPALNLKKLPHFLTLYRPTHKRSARHETGLIQAAGGLTRSLAIGSYTMADGKDCEESITKVTVFFDDTQKPVVLPAIREYVVYLLESGEESVLVESSDGTGLFTKETL